MGLTPNIKRNKSFIMKVCAKCGEQGGPTDFAPTKSVFYADGVIPMCNACVDNFLKQESWNWKAVDKLCQMADVPFVPDTWEKMVSANKRGAFYRYAQIFQETEYDGLDWSQYFKAYKDLEKSGGLEDELPLLGDAKRHQLKERWGANYDDDALRYLEELYNGMMATQNINGKLQMDQAIKICKMSYEIDQRIVSGDEFDKLLTAYDKMVKAAEFTPQNVKNINDFDTFGEAIKWLEKSGWKNKFYDGVTRDIVDETIKNFQSFNQRLYTNESNIGDEINRRIESLKRTTEIEEDYYGTSQKNADLDKYELAGYFGIDDDEFDAEVGEDGNR